MIRVVAVFLIDIFNKKIKDIVKKDENTYEIKYAEEKVSLHISLTLLKATKGRIVCENTKQNLDSFISNWDSYVKEQSTILFLNQETGSHWSLTPHIHQRITGKDDIAKGIKAIYSNS